MSRAPTPVPEDGDRADFSSGKRVCSWFIKNLRGGQTREITISITYRKDIVIDELCFKQLSPFNVEFDIPNHTSSGIKISKMEAKVI
jgi:hypothetical protein